MAVVCPTAHKQIYILYQRGYTGNYNYTISMGLHRKDNI